MGTRVHVLAKKIGLPSKDVIEKLSSLNISVASHMSILDDKTAEMVIHEFQKGQKRAPKKEEKIHKKAEKPKEKIVTAKEKIEKPKEKAPEIAKEKVEKPKQKIEPPKEKEQKPEEKEEEKPKAEPKLKEIQLNFPITVKDLAVKLSIRPNDIIKSLMKNNIFANINQNLDEQVVGVIALEYGYKTSKAPTTEEVFMEERQEVDKSKLVPRAPVVTLMGHVDHGKTSLLDYIRKTKITEREAGGITQHIGAYEVIIGDKAVTFLDTPGHEAFTAMRARGANATDVVVLVVAADDGVMPQTKEAVDHARAAEVPIVVAINKCDLPQANIDKVKRQLTELNLISEDMGGKTITAPVSAKSGYGVDTLLEMLLLEAELLELKADPTARASGVVIEGKLSPGQGPMATVLIKNGTLRTGDIVVTDMEYGKIKAMINDRGHRIKEAPPSMPVEILGLSGVPHAGEAFFVVKDDKKAKEVYLTRQAKLRERSLQKTKHITLEDFYSKMKEGVTKELKIVLKGDVKGSIEAFKKSLEDLSIKEIKVNIIHSDVGNVNDADAILAVASNAIIIGFNVKLEPKAKETIDKEGIDARFYDVIYDAIADVKAAMEGMLEPDIKEIFQGRAVVRQAFRVSGVGTIAGSSVQKGTITRQALIKLKRGADIIYKGKISSLKRFKDDVREVAEGYECGIGLSNTNDIRAGDIIEAYTIQKIARRLDK